MTASGSFAILTSVAVLGHAHWFFGNLYEAVVLAPGWRSIAGEPLRMGEGILAPGSPVRYYIPATPLTIVVTVSAGIVGWSALPELRLPLASGVGFSLASAAVTAYIVARVNLRLFFADDTTAEQKAILARRWTTLNYARLATLIAAGALLVYALTRASAR